MKLDPASNALLLSNRAAIERMAMDRAKGGDRAKATVLPPALPGERFVVDGVNCYVSGNGPPLLLVHRVNAVSSAAEMRPVFQHCMAGRTVFALDLPGFGLSDRSDRPYTPRLMTDAVLAVASEIRRRCGNVPIDALAVALGCEFLARAAVERPSVWGRLALVSPTGLAGTHARRGPTGSTYLMPWMHAALSVKLWADPFYRALTKPGVVRYFLQRTWGTKAIDETLLAYGVRTARQPGARFAPLCLLSGELFSADIHRIYERLAQPVWMSHGVLGDFTDFRSHTIVAARANWKFTVFASGAMPYFQVPDDFFYVADAFLLGLPVPTGSENPTPTHRTRPDDVLAHPLHR